MGNLILFAISAIAYLFFQPKPEKPEPGKIGDISISTAKEGDNIPYICGTPMIVKTNVVDYFEYIAEPIPAPDDKKK